MRYKLIAIDVDGTLVSDDFIISDQNKSAIYAAVDRGVHVVLCSGRSYASLKLFADELGLNNYTISFNGCIIHKNGVVIHDMKLPAKTAFNILHELKGFDIDPVVYWDIYGIYAYNKRKYADLYLDTCKAEPTFINDFTEITNDSLYKIIALGENEVLQNVKHHFKRFDNVCNMFFSGHYLFEFCSPKASKGAALSSVCSLLKVSAEDTIAIGDSDNDISMIEAAGLGVAMQNANSHVKASANYITTNDCRNHGVAEVIDKFVL